MTSPTARNALVIITVILVGAALRWMVDILSPLLLAMFLAVMVDGFARLIRHHAPSLPSGAAVLASIAISGVLLMLSATIVAANTGGFIASLAEAGPKLTRLVDQIAQGLGLRPDTAHGMLSHLDPTQYLGAVAQALQGFAASTVLVLIYLGFLIASRHAFERKAVKLFHGREERQAAVQVFIKVRDDLERYLWIQTVLGAIIAGASWLVMVLVGLENAFFWAFLIFIVNYVPIVGAAAGIVLPALFAVVQFSGYGQAAGLLAALLLITFVVGNILLPRMQGQSLNMDPVVVLLSLAFWGSLWGLTGMFLSTPLTVLSMAILAQFDGSRWIAVLLSANGDPISASREAPPEPATRLQ